MSKFLLTVCAFGLFFSSALAEEKSLEQLDRESSRIWGAEGLQRLQLARTVPSGTNQRIAFVTSLNPDCTSEGDINVRVIKQPEHGKVEIASTAHFPSFSKESNRYKCTQHKVKGVLVNYKAEKYVGEDVFDLLIIYPGGFAREVHYDIGACVEPDDENEKSPAYGTGVRTTFVVCIRTGRAGKKAVHPCRSFWNKPADQLLHFTQP
jgi:hypothetical protein